MQDTFLFARATPMADEELGHKIARYRTMLNAQEKLNRDADSLLSLMKEPESIEGVKAFENVHYQINSSKRNYFILTNKIREMEAENKEKSKITKAKNQAVPMTGETSKTLESKPLLASQDDASQHWTHEVPVQSFEIDQPRSQKQKSHRHKISKCFGSACRSLQYIGSRAFKGWKNKPFSASAGAVAGTGGIIGTVGTATGVSSVAAIGSGLGGIAGLGATGAAMYQGSKAQQEPTAGSYPYSQLGTPPKSLNTTPLETPKESPQGTPKETLGRKSKAGPSTSPHGSPHGNPKEAFGGPPRYSPKGSPKGSPTGSPRGIPRGSPRGGPKGSPDGSPRRITKGQQGI